MASENQVTLAKYKASRLVTPRRMADEYVCIDEVEYENFPVITVTASPGNVNDVQVSEIKFNTNTFLASSPLMSAFYEHYRYFRCRSVEVVYTSTDVTTDYRRTQVGCYWIPDHYSWDNNIDAPIIKWNDFMEKPNTSMINYIGNRGIFKLRYVPQLVKQDDIVEDEDDPIPDVVFQTRGDTPAGWLLTNVPNKTVDLRGPLVVFRRPYTSGAIATPEVSFGITVKCIWEFKKAKNGN